MKSDGDGRECWDGMCDSRVSFLCVLNSPIQQVHKNSHTLGHTLQRNSTKNLKQIFPEMKLRGPNSYNHVSVSDLYIPTNGLPILLQLKRWTDPVNT
jgi:hypothetical protein